MVGESRHQQALWRIVGGDNGARVRFAIEAVLAHEPTNPYDRNAIKVTIDGQHVGYLGREDAATYLSGLLALAERHGSAIGLAGQVVGGGMYADGRGMLGVFLDHDPADFGLRAVQAGHIGRLRTGLSQAIATDLEDDSYDLSWLNRLSGSHAPADVVTLRALLGAERDPIDRHFMLAELERCIYKNRDATPSALEDFDSACEQHHGEMSTIRPALIEKFGCLPVVETYRQASIRCQKARDWAGAKTWAERGIAFYADAAGRPEVVGDLAKRLAHAEAKLAPASVRTARERRSETRTVGEPTMETLVCAECGAAFTRVRTRGRKPRR